ncbi:TetR/AcrR family transcriptional regulator [Aeromicrobium sp. Leaf350]|uniref:TetR/AcrR family transcriptional regulator n=1 Tax=Aeromicrobium sp. Leaf350 TaxID=2876565 RepID=UPI001E63CB1E|nr:TetR/AcrR family transcriptional regulator [Aeromicrobium sp. Leaf350]
MTRPARRTQDERTARTRDRIIDAALTCLGERGYGSTSLGAVQARAGVARGTLLHHFPTRATLMAAAAEHLVDLRLQLLTSEVEPGDDPWDVVVELVWRDFRSETSAAALELWVAARTDERLRADLLPVQRRLLAGLRDRVVELLGADDDPRVATLLQLTMDLLTGSAMTSILVDPEQSAHRVDAWRRALPELARTASS